MNTAGAPDAFVAEQPRSAVLISAVICTYRRPEKLRAAIESLIDQTIAPDSYEIIVVDNNSGDETKAVVRDIEKKQNGAEPQIQYFLEENQGLSYARNTSISLAEAEVIAFLDDDAIASPGWLEGLLTGFNGSSDVWAVGGRVLPIWEKERPSWITDRKLPSLSLLDWGVTPRPLAWPERIIGANCSFRRGAFKEVGLFETNLGRKGKLLLGLEDIELQQRIHDFGKQIVYVPDAIVRHHVPTKRATRRYFLSRDFGNGRSQAIRTAMQAGRWAAVGRATKLLFAIPYKAAKVAIPLRVWTKPLPRFEITTLGTENMMSRVQKIFVDVGFVFQTGLLLTTWARLRRQD